MGLFGFGKKKDAPAPAKTAPAAPKAAPKQQPAKPAAKPAPAQPAASSGTPGLCRAAVCGDGISVAQFEKLSYQEWAKQAGNEKKTIQDWRNAVVDALENAKVGDSTLKYNGVNTVSKEQADRFHSVANSFQDAKGNSTWTSSTQLESLLTGKVDGLQEFGNVDAAGKWKNYYEDYRMPMWMYLKKKGLAYEGFWQHETTASWINKSNEMYYANSLEVPYLVSNIAPIGTFVKVSRLDEKGNVIASTYARVLERGPKDADSSKAEVSVKVYENLGFKDVSPNKTPEGGGSLQVEKFDGAGVLTKDDKVRNGAYSYENAYFNNDETQRAGAILDNKKAAGKALPPMKTRDDLKKAETDAGVKPPAQAASADPKAQASAGGNMLLHGFPTVAIGSNTRLVGYAFQDCLHDGGGYVLEGSSTVYVGKYPFARITDPTSDGLAVVTGDETVFVGGTPTSVALA